VAADEKYAYCGADPSGGGGSKAVATNTLFCLGSGHRKDRFDQVLNNAHDLGQSQRSTATLIS